LIAVHGGSEPVSKSPLIKALVAAGITQELVEEITSELETVEDMTDEGVTMEETGVNDVPGTGVDVDETTGLLATLLEGLGDETIDTRLLEELVGTDTEELVRADVEELDRARVEELDGARVDDRAAGDDDVALQVPNKSWHPLSQ
jgi:hypothetical protein